MEISVYLSDLRSAFERLADPRRAGPMAAYMRGKFAFYGIAATPRQAAQKAFLKTSPLPEGPEALRAVALYAFEQPEREWQYFACDLLSDLAKKRKQNLPVETLDLLEALIQTKSWWDTVDSLAGKAVGWMTYHRPELRARMDGWIEHDDFWLRRSAIIHQLRHKERTDTARLFAYCERCAHEQEFFIRKGIGWALREHSKTDAEAVQAFVGQAPLSPLSKREALKWLRDRGRI